MKVSQPFSSTSFAYDCLGMADAGYPTQLMQLVRPPKVLWYRGQMPPAGRSIVAIVGARAASKSACDAARTVAERLGNGGTIIVSGGAFGVDAAAHEGALTSGTSTFAVLGCGVDVVYPDRHAPLFSRIAKQGGVLSEYPPGTPPRVGQFPARNRILAALSDAVIVIEAASRSGSLITARLGRALGRSVFALPGSPGTDALLRERKAQPLSTTAESVETLCGSAFPPVPTLEGPMGALVSALAEGMNSPVELVARFRQPLPSILALLSEAELEGFVRRVGGSYYEVMRRGSD